MSLSKAMATMADAARLLRRPAPVIETDLTSAKILGAMLEQDIGMFTGELRRGVKYPCVVQFDGVQIKVRSVSPEELYREHFGTLADIWG